MALTRLSKIVLLAGALALGGLGIYHGQEYLRSRQVTPHVNDNLVLHLQEGRDLRDVEKIYDPADDLGFQLGNHSFTEQLPGTYVVDPEKNDWLFGLVEGRKDLTTLEIQGLAEELKRDVDVAKVEYNLPLSIPERELVIESSEDSFFPSVEQVNSYLPRAVRDIGITTGEFYQKLLERMQRRVRLSAQKVEEELQFTAENANRYLPKEIREASTTAGEFYYNKIKQSMERASPLQASLNDPYYLQGKMWGQTSTGMDLLLELLEEHGLTPEDLPKVKVYILDTGIICDHQDQETEVCVTDKHGHGTHVGGTVAALTNNGVGVSSVNVGGFIQLYAKQILDENGRGNIVSIAKAIVDATDEGAMVINMSLGGRGESLLLKKAIQYADERGVIVVVAAGNDNADAKYYSPANIEEAITVAAVGIKEGKLTRADFSNWGKGVDFCAPGTEIVSTLPLESRIGKERPDKILEPGFGILQGTSMAAPHVTAHVALMKALDLELTRQDIEEISQETGITPKTDKPINICINTGNAFRAVMERKQQKEEDRQRQSLEWLEHKGPSYSDL